MRSYYFKEISVICVSNTVAILSPNIVRVMKCRRLRWAGHVVRMEECRSAFKSLTGKPTGKRPLGGTRCRWEDNIRDTYQCGELG